VVRIIEQVATIKSVTTLTNLTGMYADVWDGTSSDLLTDDSPGATLSGALVDTHFTKDKDDSFPYTVVLSDQARKNEVSSDRFLGLPFTVNQKAGTDSYIRLHFTTTDNPVDFTIDLLFEWEPVDGGWLEVLV
jgi:hypothetical protein